MRLMPPFIKEVAKRDGYPLQPVISVYRRGHSVVAATSEEEVLLPSVGALLILAACPGPQASIDSGVTAQ